MNNQQLINRIDEVIVTSAVDTPPAEFLATHLPFKSLKYTSSGIGEKIEKSIGEEAFFSEYLLNQADQHNLIIVQGDSGSGKSHFIRWLTEKYELQKDSNEVIVAIKRHQNSLKSAIHQILKSEAFNEIRNNELSKKLASAKELLDDSELLFSIKNNLLTKLESNTNFIDSTISKRESDKLIEFIKSKMVFDELLKQGPFQRIYQKIAANSNEQVESDFDARFTADDFIIPIDLMEEIDSSDEVTSSARSCARTLFRKPGFRTSVAEYLNTYVDAVIQLCLQMSGEDFRQIIYEMRKYLKSKNKNLTLFIEDITTFTGIDKSLIEALNDSHQGNDEICRIFSVLGTTRSYYDSFFPDNLKQRVTGRVFIEVESVFESEKDVVIMAARYLNAINTTSEELNHWLQLGANIKEIPVSTLNNEHKWSIFQDSELGDIPLFPFNERAIVHLYNTLQEKTPRVFLKQVIKYIYAKYLKNPEDFPGTWQSFKSYYDIPLWKNELYDNVVSNQAQNKSNQLSCVLRVWGDRTVLRTRVNGETRLGDLPKEVFETFNVPFINGKQIDGEEYQINTPNENVEPTSPVPPQKPHPEPLKKSAEQKKYDTEMRVLREWFDQQKPLIIHKELRTEISTFLYSFIQWQNYGISIHLATNFFVSGAGLTSISRISIEDQPVEINELGIIIKKTKEDYQFLQAILSYKHLGKGSWNFPNSIDYLLLVYNWIDKNMNSIKDRILNTVEEKEWNMDRWAIYNQYVSCILNGQIDGNESVEEIYFKIMNTTTLQRETSHSDSWNRFIKTIKDESINENANFLKKNTNILLGSASADTNKYFINAQLVLKEIKSLIENSWGIGNIPQVSPNKSQVFVSYTLLNDFLKILLNLTETELQEFQKQHNTIKNYVKREEIRQIIYKIKSFLQKTLSEKAQELYSPEDFKLALGTDEEIDVFTYEIEEIIVKIETHYEKNIDCLIEISRLSIHSLKSYVELLKNMDKLLEDQTNKYNQVIIENKLSLDEYKENIYKLKKNISNVQQSIKLLGVSDSHVINKN